MIKVVFIDWGNVFATFFDDKEVKLNKILEPFGLDWKEFNNTWKEFYFLRSAGKIKTDDEIESHINKAFQKEIPTRELIKIIVESHFITKEHIEIIKELKKKCKVAILSNNIQEWVERVLNNYKIDKLFDAIIISSAIGARKPDALIYYEGLKKFSVKSNEAVFISDELSEDLVTASGIGMKTIWFRNQKLFENEYDKKISQIYQPDGIIENLKELLSLSDFERKFKNTVYVFIDASNLWEAQKAKRRFLDYEKTIKFIEKKFEASSVKVFYYTAYPAEGTRNYSLDGKHKFFTFLKKGLKIEVRKKELKRIPVVDAHGEFIKEKGNMDVEITIDALHNLEKYHTAIFFTGDSDFLALVIYLKNSGKKVFIFSSQNNISEELRTAGDGYSDVLKVDNIWGRELKYRERTE